MRGQVRHHDSCAGAALVADVEPLYTANLVIALLSSCAFGFALATFNLLPKYLITELGTSASEVGMIMSIFGIATVVGAPFAGVCVDRLPRRHLIALGSVVMMLTSLGFVVFGDVIVAVYALRAAQGLCFAAVFTAIGALVTDIVPPARLSQGLGLAGASMLIMSAVAPPIIEPLAVVAGWPSVFFVAAVMAVIAAVLSQLVREDRAPRDEVAGSAVSALWSLLGRRLIVHYAFVTAAIGAAFGVMFTFGQPYVMELGRSDVGGFFVAYAAVAIFVRVAFGDLPDRLGRFRVAVFTLNLYTLVVLATALLRPAWFEVIGGLLGLAHGMFFPAFNAMVITRFRDDERGRVFSVFTGAFYGGLAIGVFVFGFVAELVGYPVVFVATAALTAVAGAVLIFSSELGDMASRS